MNTKAKTVRQLLNELDEVLDKAERLIAVGKRVSARGWLAKSDRILAEIQIAKEALLK